MSTFVADRLLDQSIASERAVGDQPGLIESLTLRGVVALESGDRHLATEVLAEVLEIAVYFGEGEHPFRDCGIGIGANGKSFRNSSLAAASLTMVESGWRTRAEPFLLQIGAHLQIGLDGLDQPQPKVRVLAVAKEAPAAFSGIVGGFPGWIPQEGTEPDEVVGIQVLLLATQRRDLRRFGIRMPDLVPPLGFLRRLSVAQVVCPDRKPVFQERASHPQFTASWTAKSRRASVVPLESGSRPDGERGCGTARGLRGYDGPRPSRARAVVAGRVWAASLVSRSMLRPWPDRAVSA